ncbi:2,3-dihydro-2,3-dihydroxybenzoate synthetase (plasmid) [Rhodococcus sp. 2G]|uniref:isochorismatase family protein n=1 Tax=Rhodococcus sp. 2G TaxID=1570939 RepID=UPI0009036101|nr:isochorismatase family protein [Rhodococcus sp. 2G]APE12606.1 2,3-dihydro-2,3-dihydroxybenzoate synthetase [Rhodococcus sp. 2G]
MPIPPIVPYSLPDADELVPNQVPWRIDPARCALLIHDMQRYFISAYDSTVDPMQSVLVNLAEIRKRCQELSIPVIYTMQPGNQHPSRRGILADFWGTGMTVGFDTEVVPELAPSAGDIQVTKWRYSAFQRTDLRDLLAFYNRDQLMVTGVYAHMGCMLSTAEAFMSDIQPFMVLDATADFTRDEHLMALNYTARRCGVVLSSAELLDQLTAGSCVTTRFGDSSRYVR